MKPGKITIIGCGLIGGSAALALGKRRPELPIACLDLPARLPAMREAGLSAAIGTLDDQTQHVPESAVVIVATPVEKVLDTIRGLGPHVKPGTIVTDVGSTKMRIMSEARALLPEGVHFIGGHPMAGSERSGIEAADPLLFSERAYLLCPYPDTPPEALLTLLDLAESLLARPITMDPEEHDRIMAMVSHLPQLVSIALMLAAQSQDSSHAMLDELAGRGFLDVTRLAASDYGVWRGILESNAGAIESALDSFTQSLGRLRHALRGGEAAGLWETASRHRRIMGPESRARLRKPDLRGIIDQCDKQILAALGRRIQAVRKIGKLKKSQAAPVLDPDRERRMIAQRMEWGNSLDLPQEMIDELWKIILSHSNRIQRSDH